MPKPKEKELEEEKRGQLRAKKIKPSFSHLVRHLIEPKTRLNF